MRIEDCEGGGGGEDEGEQMEKSCLGNSCLVKCDGETAAETEGKERERDKTNGGREDGVNNKQYRQEDRWDVAKRQTTYAHTRHTTEDKDTHTRTWIFARRCQSPRWHAGSYSGSFDAASSINRKQLACPRPKPEPPTSQTVTGEEGGGDGKGLNRVSGSQKLAAGEHDLLYGESCGRPVRRPLSTNPRPSCKCSKIPSQLKLRLSFVDL